AIVALFAAGLDLAGAQPAPAVSPGGLSSPGADSGLAASGAVGLDLSFEEPRVGDAAGGWALGGSAVVDDGVARHGQRSLRLDAGDGRDARATLRLEPPLVEGQRIRFSLQAR